MSYGTLQRNQQTGLVKKNKQTGGIRRNAWTPSPKCCCFDQGPSGSGWHGSGSQSTCPCPTDSNNFNAGFYNNHLIVTVDGGLATSGWARNWATGAYFDLCNRGFGFYPNYGTYIWSGDIGGTACAVSNESPFGCCWESNWFGTFKVQGGTFWLCPESEAQGTQWFNGCTLPNPPAMTCNGKQCTPVFTAAGWVYQGVKVGVCQSWDSNTGIWISGTIWTQLYYLDGNCNPVLPQNPEIIRLVSIPAQRLTCGGSVTWSWSWDLVQIAGAWMGEWPATCSDAFAGIPFSGSITISDVAC